MRRTLALTLGFAALVALATPAAAQEAEAPDDANLTLDEPDARATKVVPMLCKVVQREQTVGVACQWRPAEAPVAGYRLGRLELGGRKIIFRTGDLTKTTFGDVKVRKGLQYAYILQLLGQGGRVIGQSRPQLVLVVPPRNDGTTTTTIRRPDASTSSTSTSAPGGVNRVNPSPPATTGQDQAGQVARLRAEIERLQALQRERQRTTTTVARTRPTQPARPGGPSTTVPAGTPTTAAPTTAPPTTVAARTS